MVNKNELPDWDKFVVYLKSRRGIKIDSGIKSRHAFIYSYFTHRSFDLNNFCEMLYGLMEGTVGKEKPLKKSSLNKYLTTGKHFCKILNLDFLDDFDGYKVDEPPITVIDAITQKRIAECYLKRDKCERADNYRYKCAIYTLIYTGMRISELCNLEWQDYSGDTLLIRFSKTRKPRIIPVASKLKPLLNKLPYINKYIFGKRNTKLSPDTLNLEIKRRCKKLGIQMNFTAKHFRSSFDTLVSLSGGEATLPKISRITGHSMDTAYKYYMRFDVAVLKDALESSHPLLKNTQDIDTLKRTLLESIKKIVDMTKFNVSLEITPKSKNIRKLYIS